MDNAKCYVIQIYVWEHMVSPHRPVTVFFCNQKQTHLK